MHRERAVRRLVFALFALSTGCFSGTIGDSDNAGGSAPAAEPAKFEPARAVVPRLTVDQHRNAVAALLGGAVADKPIEADTAPYLFNTIGAATTTISERGVGQFEDAALSSSAAVFADEKRRATLVGCEPTAADDACARGFVRKFLRRAFRRPVDSAELDEWIGVGKRLGAESPWIALETIVAGVLQAPSFLYRVELGSPDPTNPGWNKLDAFELASRLSFLIWSSVPDDALLDAAETGKLESDEEIAKQVDRLLDDPRARKALASFQRQWLGLSELDSLNRDPAKFPDAKPGIGASMRGEIERLLDDVTLDDRDYRDLFDRRTTWVDQNLAALYKLDVVIPAGTFERVVLPVDGPRGGLLTTAGILSLNAHPEITSPTRRGKFVRERLLCENVPAPPPDIATNLDDGKTTEGAPKTVREKLERHRTDPKCAGCHRAIDPIGLGLEDFDALGVHREKELDRPVDARGLLDSVDFVGGRALGKLLHNDPRIPACLARQLFRFASGRLEAPSEEPAMRELASAFAASGHRFRALVHALVKSRAFRYARAR